MNPLFRHFAEHIRREAQREFQASTTGRILSEINKLSRRGPVGSTRLNRLTGDLIKAAGRGGLGRGLRGVNPIQIERYARTGTQRALLNAMFDALGPLGAMFRSMLRPSRRPMTSIGREIEAAKNLLKVFEPGALAETRPAAPARPATPPGRPAGRFTMPEDAAEAQRLLESMGFTVTPPPGQQPAGPTRPRTRRPRPPQQPPQQPPREPPADETNDPLYTGEMIRVQSSNVHSIGFILDRETPAHSTLKVRFLQKSRRSGSNGKKVGGPMYFYYRVHPAIFRAFQRAASKGKFVWDRLRIRGTVTGHQYHYELMGISEGYVPRKAFRAGPAEHYISRRVRVRTPNNQGTEYLESQLPDQFVRMIDGRPRDASRTRGPNRGNGRGYGPRGARGPGR